MKRIRFMAALAIAALAGALMAPQAGADGANADGARLVGATAERPAGATRVNADGARVQVVAAFAAGSVQYNTDGERAVPPPYHPLEDMRVTWVVNHLLGVAGLSPTLQALLDLNNDGKLDVSDIVTIIGE